MLLFLTVPWVGLQFVTMVFPDHTRLLFHSIVHDRFYVFYGVGYIIKIGLSLIPLTPGKRQSKTSILSTNVDKKNVRNRIFDCHLSPVWRPMTIENTVSSDF